LIVLGTEAERGVGHFLGDHGQVVVFLNDHSGHRPTNRNLAKIDEASVFSDKIQRDLANSDGLVEINSIIGNVALPTDEEE
jgi:hypothetical protein